MKISILKLCTENWKSALTVALINIPLSLALAIATGATPVQGIITAFWAGLIGAMFGGSHFNIIGPTGALSGILVAYAIVNGSETLPFIALISGVLILIAYVLRIDRYIVFIPQSVVHGFTLGVAFIIGLGQIDNALGLQNIPKTEHLLQNIWLSLQHISETQIPIFAIFIISTTFIFFWNKKYQKIPGAILIAIIGIVTAAVLKKINSPFQFVTLGDKYPTLEAALFQNIFHDFSWNIILTKKIIIVSLATAAIAILETLMSGQIAQTITKKKFDRKKEVLGLGIANLFSGIMGGIPATAALARTALNIKSGATNRTSSILNSLFVGIITLFIFNYFKLLPLVLIASILTITAIGMIGKKHFIKLIENEKIAFILSMFVAVITIAEDPIIGIIIGTCVALIIFVQKVSLGQTEILLWKDGKMVESLLKNDFLKRDTITSDTIVYKISGTLTYINMPAHLEAIQKIKGNKHVIVSLRHAFYADSDGIDYLREIIEYLHEHNSHVIISGVNKEIQKMIEKESFYKNKQVEGKIFSRTSEALNALLEEKTT